MTNCHQEIGTKEGPEPGRQGQDQIGWCHHKRRRQEHPFVAIAVRQCAENCGKKIKEKRCQSLDHAPVSRGKTKPTILHRSGQVQGRNGVEAVPAHPLKDLHRIGGPERAGKLTNHTSLCSHIVILGVSSLWKNLLDSLLFPNLAQLDNHFDGLVHITGRYPLVTRVEVVLTGKDVGGWQTHERQA